MGKHLKLKRPRPVIVLLVFAMLLAGGALLVIFRHTDDSMIVRYEPTPTLSSAPSWRGLQPGVTTITQALATMNEPDEIIEIGEFTIYRFRRDQPAWNLVELWTKANEGQDIPISAIYRTIPFKGMASLEPSDVLPLVWKYGRPDYIGWGGDRYARYFIWANRGVVVDVGASVDLFTWQELGYSMIMIFEPMSVEEFFATPWPYPIPGEGFPTENQYPGGDRPDIYPRDPYDWDNLPTPPPG